MIYEIAGGMRGDKPSRPSSQAARRPLPDPEHLDVKMDFDSLAQAGSMLGSGGVTVMEEGTCMVWAAEISCSSSTMSPAASAPRAVKGVSGSCRSYDASSTAAAGKRIWTPAPPVRQHRRPHGLRLRRREIAPITSTLQHFRMSTRRMSKGSAARSDRSPRPN